MHVNGYGETSIHTQHSSAVATAFVLKASTVTCRYNRDETLTLYASLLPGPKHMASVNIDPPAKPFSTRSAWRQPSAHNPLLCLWTCRQTCWYSCTSVGGADKAYEPSISFLQPMRRHGVAWQRQCDNCKFENDVLWWWHWLTNKNYGAVLLAQQ